jgi:hypothetical protein
MGQWLTDLGIGGKGSTLAEIGSCGGWFAADLLNQSTIEKVYLIDGWRYYKYWDDSINEGRDTQWQRMKQCFDRVYQYGDRAVMLRENSLDAAKIFASKSFDVVYIDANHSYEAVKADIEAWAPKAKSVLAGHDYRDGWVEVNKCNFGVKSAVDEWAAANGYDVATSDMDDAPREPSWYIQVR